MYSRKSHAKVNIFLKITGFKNGYHTLESRFVKLERLYDTITFEPCECDTFTVEIRGKNTPDIPRESNTLFKAYKLLNEETGNLDILEFFYKHKVVLQKRIPSGAGLGGGSSNAAIFLKMVNEQCNLKLSTRYLSELGSRIGADVPFFVHDYQSADVSGFGEIVEERNEKLPDLIVETPPLHCSTSEVFKAFHESILPAMPVDDALISRLRSMDSIEILSSYRDISLLNDLYDAALRICPTLHAYAREGWLFSGSGSSFFKLA